MIFFWIFGIVVSTWDLTDSIKFYLFRAMRRRIARSTSVMLYYKEELSDALPIDSSAFEWITEESVSNKRAYLQQTIASLPERQREVIYLRFYSNFTFEEVASIMKIDVRSAYNLTYKALGKLRSSLSSQRELLLGAILTGLGMLFTNFL